jgi:peptidoglycan hydrolase-like protein with peptidoglycan-binding domain
MRRGGKRLLTAVVLALVPILAFAGTGQAAATYVDGANTLNNTDLVLMWQAVLYSENYLNAADLDGYFGPRTDDATERWQADAGGLQVDGWVGDQSPRQSHLTGAGPEGLSGV